MFKILINKTSLQIISALFFVLLIMFVSNYIVFQNSTAEILRQTMENSQLANKNVVKSFDECFKEINNTIYSMNLLNYQVYEEGGHENLNMSNIFLLVNNTKQLISQNYIFDYIISFNSSDLVISSAGTSNFTDIFEQKYKNSIYAPEFWKRFATFKHDMKIIPSTYYEEANVNGNLVRRKLLGIVGNNKMSNSEFNIIFFIYENRLLSQVNQQNLMEDSSLTVLDKDKNVIITTAENYDSGLSENIQFNKKSELIFRKGEFEYYCIKSDYNDFIYVNKIRYKYSSFSPVIRINQIIMLVTIFPTIIICVFLSLWLYKPIKNLSKLVENKGGKVANSNYSNIYSNIKQIQNENQLFRDQLDFVEDEVRRSIFFRMLNDSTYYKNQRGQIDNYFKTIFLCKAFTMISFKFEFISQIKSNVKAKDAQDSFAPDDIANNIQKNLDGPFESRFVFYLGNMTFIALVGLKKTTSREVVLEKTNFIIEELSKIAGSKLMITGAVSKFYFEASDCGTAYEDIKICNAFRCINANNTVIDYEKISFVSDVYLPSDYAEKLSNNIFSGNIKESKAIIDQIIENNVGNRINYIKMEGVLRSIFDNIINTCHSLGYSKEYISNLELGFFNQVKSISNFEDMQKFLYTIIEQVATDINIKKQSKLNKTYLLEYINLHYAEDLCLESMALMADTSPKYFSNYFKKAIGTNFVEYLSKVRINHAKELLKNSKMPVNEIGEKVGFHINGTFTYTFKKYYGVSPNEYRKTINEYK